MADLTVVLGGTRSGKSAVAESLVRPAAQVVYVATAQPDDEEMRQRIKAHLSRRPAAWLTVESTDLAAAVHQAPVGAAVLIDGLGAWLATRLEEAGAFGAASAADVAAATISTEVDALIQAVHQRPAGDVVVVAEEVGSSVVPPDRGTRLWVDVLGTSVQQLSSHASRVLLVHAGRAVALPEVPPPAGVAAAASLRVHGDTMVAEGAEDFAVNIHGEGPAPHLRAALADAVATAGRYPDGTAATAAVAARHGRPVDEVLLTAGAAEAFWLLASAISAKRAVVVHPQFTEPEAALRAAGILVDHVLRSPEDEWALHPDEVPDDANLVVIGMPNNPTGTMDDPDAVAALCRPGRITVVDEAFIDFVTDPDAGMSRRRELPGLVVLRSVTKLWGLAGVRAGYLLAPPGVVRRCVQRRQPWPLSTPALRALEVCAADESYRRQVATTVAQWRSEVVAGLRSIDSVIAWDSAANFVLVKVPDGARVHRSLADQGIALRPSTFPGLSPDYLRIAVRPPAATARLLAALRNAVAS